MGYFGNRQQSKLHFAKHLIAACFLLFAVRDVSAGEETCTYENLRYEFSIAASCDYFDRFDAIIEADNGDGILLRSAAEGLEIRVYGSLVREIENEFSANEWPMYVDPSLEIVRSENSYSPLAREARILLTPANRDHVTIYAEASTEVMAMNDLSRELELIVESMQAK